MNDLFNPNQADPSTIEETLLGLDRFPKEIEKIDKNRREAVSRIFQGLVCANFAGIIVSNARITETQTPKDMMADCYAEVAEETYRNGTRSSDNHIGLDEVRICFEKRTHEATQTNWRSYIPKLAIGAMITANLAGLYKIFCVKAQAETDIAEKTKEWHKAEKQEREASEERQALDQFKRIVLQITSSDMPKIEL